MNHNSIMFFLTNFLHLRFINSKKETSTSTVFDGTNLSQCEALSTIIVKENQLIDSCSLGQEFHISFKLYMSECINARYILDVIDLNNNNKKLLYVRTHNRRQKLIIQSYLKRFTLKAVTTKVNLQSWDNTIEIVQEKVNGKVSPETFINTL